ncbi:Mur ligase family protein [Staphylococcus sp. 17KM0847]|uniref:Mur ligase family protein n=1 Tax=Staphylococcus sp. 17KM0847 TaxID=2583989 RepID=UPI0015DC32BE|nr:Mur ligase family protein [Staphylococcus sp. 17KM0847]QLK86872.1 glutamate ligase [Staphylococcus sp. 17KM0847]
MISLKTICDIVHGHTVNIDKNNENHMIDDFESIFKHVKSKNTAYISPNKTTWAKQLGRNKNAPDGNDLIDLSHKEVGVIITEKAIEAPDYNIPQIIVEDSIIALKTLAIHIRNQYQNPLIAITGSMGKSSTRMLTTALLQNYHVLENRGNNNVRSAIYINMLKLIKNPDFAVIETSLNAINYIEDTAVYLRPDIAVVTGIGAAHFSTFKSIEDIAKIKSRIFHGLTQNGIAIINHDTLFADYLVEQASSYTNNVYTYSIDNHSTADLSPEMIAYDKGAIRFDIYENNTLQTYKLNTISSGMVSNTLAALLVLKHLNIQANNDFLDTFRPFSKILKMKQIVKNDKQLTLLDDTHNASLPAMINAIKAFDTQAKFFQGNKIIALGQISDLGHKSKEVHEALIPVLENSHADYILCLDDALRFVVNKVKNKHITWYASKEMMMNDLKFLCNADSITLLKSSSSGTSFPELAQKLPDILKNDTNIYKSNNLFDEMRRRGQSYIIVDNKTNAIEQSVNTHDSMTLEGMGALLYYIYAMDKSIPNETLTLKKWPTNKGMFATHTKFTTYELLNNISHTAHPSALYELSDYLFSNFANRKKYIKNIVQKYGCDPSISVNLTGRFRVKERQSFSVHDLYQIYKDYKYELFRFRNTFLIGNRYKSGYIRGETKTIIFTSYSDLSSLKQLISF